MRGIALSLAIAALFVVFGACMAKADEAYRVPLPLPAGFRLSGGVAVEGNKVTLNALANGISTVTVNRVTWSEGGSTADSRAGFKDLAPYGGLGYTQSFGGFKVNWDAGALFGAVPTRPWTMVPGLPENLALQNDYLESQNHRVAIEPVAEVTFSFKF